MQENSQPNSGIDRSSIRTLLIVGVGALLLFQVIAFVRLLFFREDVWTAGDYMVDKFGHISLGDIIFSSVALLLLLFMVEFWRKHKLVLLAFVLLWLRTAVGRGMGRYYGQTYNNVGHNLLVFDQFPWLLAAIGSSLFGCLATLATLMALVQGETLQVLLDDWTDYLTHKLAKTP